MRIISGRWRGRKIAVPDCPGVRPSPDRVRETLFNWLGRKVIQARCLDWFAGSGVLGFEALSRGATSVLFVDNAPIVATHLRQVIHQLQAANAIVIQAEATKLVDVGSQFDLVFIDPPFRQGIVPLCCEFLNTHHWLANNALIYIEMEAEAADWIPPLGWQLLRSLQAGQVHCKLYQKESQNEPK